jgi:AcrR family transcriptional regulator
VTTSPIAPTRRVRNPRGEGAALREQIVATALEVVDNSGVPALTLRGVARTIGVSAPAIYAHFANIDAILLAVAERAFADLAEHLTAAAAGVNAPPATRLRAICRAYLDYAEHHPGRYQVMFGGQWDATSAFERGAVEQRGVNDLGLEVLTAFVNAVADNDVTADPRGSANFTDAVVTWVTLHGYAHQRLVARAFPWPPEITEHVLDRVAPTNQ